MNNEDLFDCLDTDEDSIANWEPQNDQELDEWTEQNDKHFAENYAMELDSNPIENTLSASITPQEFEDMTLEIESVMTFSFSDYLQEREGECFRSEIRDTGIYLCGIHQSCFWPDDYDNSSTCPYIFNLVDALTTCYWSAVSAAIEKETANEPLGLNSILEDYRENFTSPPQ